MKRLLSLSITGLLFLAISPTASSAEQPGPNSGSFSAWTKILANGSQIKFYAKYPQPGQKIQFLYQDSSGEYKELAWLKVSDKHLNADGSYRNLQNGFYFIRTFDLREGKNRVRIAVDGKIVWGTKTYSPKPPQEQVIQPPTDEVAPEETFEATPATILWWRGWRWLRTPIHSNTQLRFIELE